ncbi:MAG: hypothetical protein K9H64_04730 [Bacteroidales bacterium]|nr:hypothetical protein [Bacteroidales bacterium]MCF8455091.1 hypothetical protein [Bacteroidales bacterium]
MTHPENTKLKDCLKGLNIVYLALLFGQLMLGALFVILIYSDMVSPEMDAETQYIINTSALLISIIAIPAGYYLYSLRGKHAQSISNEDQKIEIFRNITILKLATFELGGMANLLAFLICQSQQSLFIFAIVIIVFLLNKPSQQKYFENFE